MTYERRTVLTIRPQPAVNAGYEHWFPELRRKPTTHAAAARPAADGYPERWLPDVAARSGSRANRPRVSR
jgi:hypothetical protein